jgi:hypothetical protein
MKKKNFIYLLFALFPSFLLAQKAKAKEEISTIVIDENYDDEADWDKEYHSGQQHNERSTMYDFQRQRGYPTGKRVGCTCMDGEAMTKTGKGACSGHGGVRYWHFEQPDGVIIKHPTDRHLSHPDVLSEPEKENLSAYSVAKKEKPWNLPSGWTTLGIVAILCATFAFVFRTYVENINKPPYSYKDDEFEDPYV